MNMLCGLFAASDGEMRMNGHDIQSNEGRVYRRSNTGIAPQHDVLWDMLTVYEHLVFFAVIKGMDQRDAEKAATDMLAELALVEKRNVYTKSLSGGQKRRLSVAIAMIGGSSIVVLDEPTSGVDPQSARQIWELIQRNKQGRTILLSTHSMEEVGLTLLLDSGCGNAHCRFQYRLTCWRTALPSLRMGVWCVTDQQCS